MTKRILAVLACIALLGAGAKHPAKHAAKSKHPGKPVLPIAVMLNGAKLDVNPPPTFYQYHLLVPVRRILTALGLSFEKDGRYVRTYAGSKTIVLEIGSRTAQVDNRAVQMETAPVEIKNTLFAPLHFFTDALGAQAVFNRQTNSVEIISTLLGRTGSGIVTTGGGVQMTGTITAVDLDSDPPSLTLSSGASARTLPINSDVSVVVQDVNSGTSNQGDLGGLHVGDYAQLNLDKQGHVKRIVDAYGSRMGSVAASAAGQIVLDDGHVVAPARSTTITLNGSNATIDQIQIGDAVTVRYNIDSSEPRDIIATRKSQGTPPPATPVSISGITVSPAHPLRQGDTLRVTMRGTPSGLAAFDIGPYVTNQTLQESQPGVYTGTYVVPRGVNFANAPVFGRLNAHGSDAPVAESQGTVTVATDEPVIEEFAPDNGATVNNPRPSIYATFSSGTAQVNPSSVKLVVNGHDVTSSSVRANRFIHYSPGVDYPDGPLHVTVYVSDQAGNTVKRSWTFFIKK